MQNCEPIPNNIMFNLTNLFPANKSYVAYRYLAAQTPASRLLQTCIVLQMLASALDCLY